MHYLSFPLSKTPPQDPQMTHFELWNEHTQSFTPRFKNTHPGPLDDSFWTLKYTSKMLFLPLDSRGLQFKIARRPWTTPKTQDLNLTFHYFFIDFWWFWRNSKIHEHFVNFCRSQKIAFKFCVLLSIWPAAKCWRELNVPLFRLFNYAPKWTLKWILSNQLKSAKDQEQIAHKL